MKLKESYYSKVQDEYDENQSSLFNYSVNNPEYTKIAVVRKPSYGIENVVNEVNKQLAPPTDLLEDFWEKKNEAGFEHNKAWKKVNFRDRYLQHLFSDGLDALERLENRLNEGQSITLVCYEKPPKNCHRHILKEVIESGKHNYDEYKNVVRN